MKQIVFLFILLWVSFNTLWADLEHSKAISEEVLVYEGVIFKLNKNDAEFKMYNEEYALYPKSKKLKQFLSNQDSDLKVRSLRSQNSTTQFQNQDQQMVFYYSGTKGSNLYNQIALQRFSLIKQEIPPRDKNKNEKAQEIYIVQNYNDYIPDATCQIIQGKKFIRDRARNELLINLDKKINARLLSQTETELFLECQPPANMDIFE